MSIFQLTNRKYKKAVEWVREHSYGIDSLEKCEINDFNFLENILKDKQIVWLGENGHGIAEHNLLKSKLIEFLYHKMGFKVIAFESGLSECYSANYFKDDISVNELMDKSIFSLWKTEETLPLFELIKGSDLNLIGFDFQPSSKQNLFVDLLDKLDIDLPLKFKLSIKALDKATMDWYMRIGKLKGEGKKIPKHIMQEYLETQKELTELFSSLHKSLEELEKEFIRKDMHIYFQLIQRVIENRRLLLSNLATGQRTYKTIRDQIMAHNLEWICEKLYPNEKIIVWAHNSHIYKNYENLIKYKPMGSLMSPEMVSKSYYLGLFMYEGKAALNNKTIYDLVKPPKKSLEDYMNHNKSSISFLDFSNVSLNELNKWIFNKTLILESGTMQKLITPAQQLDGIFFIKKVSPPHYL